jgi:hypothetical protein
MVSESGSTLIGQERKGTEEPALEVRPRGAMPFQATGSSCNPTRAAVNGGAVPRRS